MSRLLALLLIVVCGAFACSRGSATPKLAGESARAAGTVPTKPASAGGDSLATLADHGRVLGSATAPVWLLIASDFQCPWCKTWHDSTFPALKRDYVDAGKVRVAYLNFPLSMHANALPSAMAAMCAAAQGKFWEAHARIFETQSVWQKLPRPEPYLDSVAIAAGADAAKLKRCTQDRAMLALIQADQARAQKAGVESTPTFFVGGTKIEGAQPLKVFRRVIDSVLAAGAAPK